jgi:hypothetical protein
MTTDGALGVGQKWGEKGTLAAGWCPFYSLWGWRVTHGMTDLGEPASVNPWETDGWATVVWTDRLVLFIRVGPNALIQLLFQHFKLIWVCKMQKQTFLCSKIYQTLHGNIFNYKEHLSLWEEVEIPNRIWIKIPGSKLSLNLAWIYLGSKLLWKFLVNFPKF